MIELPDLKQAQSNALKVNGAFKLPLGQIVWRGQAGEFLGAGTGSSLDFHDHRTYVPGDDPRYINWQAYARTGQHTMKLYREEVRPVVDVVLDVSASMFHGAGKGLRSAELLHFVVAAALSEGSSVRSHLISGSTWREVEVAELNECLWGEPAQQTAQEAGGGNPTPDLSVIPWRIRSLRIFLSDLLYPGHPTALLATLRERQSAGMIIAPYAQEEMEPHWSGPHELIESETGLHHRHRITPKMLEHYHQAYREHFTMWRQQAAGMRVMFSRVASSTPLDEALRSAPLQDGLIQAVS